MSAYGGYIETYHMLLDHGADLDNMDVDGDTHENLAANRDHAAVLIMLEEERRARLLGVREAGHEVAECRIICFRWLFGIRNARREV
jgi:hypothetical protein